MDAGNARRSLVAIAAIVALIAAAAVVSAVTAPKRRVILYGDSLALEAREFFAFVLKASGENEVVDQTPSSRSTATTRGSRPGSSPAPASACTGSAAVPDRTAGNSLHRRQERTPGRDAPPDFRHAGGPPSRVRRRPRSGPGWRPIHVHASVPSEGADKGCVDERIPVRADDGIHFCLVGIPRDADRCPVYSSGAARFGFAMAEPVRRPRPLREGTPRRRQAFEGHGITVTPPSDTAEHGNATPTR
jgi:hypothetical protein